MFLSAKMYCFFLISLTHLVHLDGMVLETAPASLARQTISFTELRVRACFSPSDGSNLGRLIETASIDWLSPADVFPVASVLPDGRSCYVMTAVFGRPGMPIGVTLEGTRHCGLGNTATEANPFGKEIATDRCCQIHDRCPFSLRAGESFGDYTNNEIYSQSDCECDEEFRQCIYENRNSYSDLIGRLYFNDLKVTCLQLMDISESTTEMYNVTQVEEESPQLTVVQNELYVGVTN